MRRSFIVLAGHTLTDINNMTRLVNQGVTSALSQVPGESWTPMGSQTLGASVFELPNRSLSSPPPKPVSSLSTSPVLEGDGHMSRQSALSVKSEGPQSPQETQERRVRRVNRARREAFFFRRNTGESGERGEKGRELGQWRLVSEIM